MNAQPTIEIRLNYRGPYAWETVAGWLAARAIAGVESIEGATYARDGVRATNQPDDLAFVATIPAGKAAKVQHIAGRLCAVFDLHADPSIIGTHLRRDRGLSPLLRRKPGMRVPGAWDPFELAVRAIVGQQVSVRAATTILGRIGQAHGFSAERLADATIEGMPRRRAEAIRALARAVAAGEAVLERRATLDETISSLVALPGIGPWTAHYIAMRALGETDAFPSGDLILRRHAGDLTERELLRRAEAWRPWRAYAAMLLWTR